MMRGIVARFVLVVAAGACSDSGPRFTAKEDHFSIVEPPGFVLERQLGAHVWTHDRTTISIKVAHGKDPARVIPATRQFLEGQRGVAVSSMRRHALGDFSAATFDLTFDSPETGERYARRHTVLVSRSGRAFHVFVTSPEGALAPALATFEQVVASLEEEG